MKPFKPTKFKTPQLVLCSIVLGSLFVVATKPADAVLGVGDIVDVAVDTANAPNWLIQAGHMVSELNNQITQITNEKTRIQQEIAEVRHISNLSISDGRAGALNTFTSTASQFNSGNPSSQAAALALRVINGQSGALQPANLTSLINDIRGATGANASRDAQQEGIATVASSVQELAVLEASKIAQEQANYYEALNRRAQLMDTLGNPTDNFDY